MTSFQIAPVSTSLKRALQDKIDQKTKPLDALGRIETIALQIGLVQNTLEPRFTKPSIVVFAGDHGVTEEGVSAFPSAVTAQMVLNFLSGGAAINVFAAQNGIGLKIVDAGVNFDFAAHDELVDLKIGRGTNNFVRQAAMTAEQCDRALQGGAGIVTDLHREGSNVVGFGEMGIGNTSSAALIMSLLCHLPVERCVGAGAGLDSAGVRRKIVVLEKARMRFANTARSDPPSVTDVLREVGGFEIVMICGAMLRAAELRMTVLVDGFIATAALLAASRIDENVVGYCIFTHRSDEQGHSLMLQQLEAQPLLDLGLRLGEGTGPALCFPLVQSAVNFLNSMATFDSAGVSGKD